jgi:hypothetical protein
MGTKRGGARRPNRHTFRPALDDQLEKRSLLSRVNVFAVPPSHFPPVQFRALTFNGGKGVRVQTRDGEFTDIHLTGEGTVRAFPLPGDRVAVRVDGSTASTVLSFDPRNPQKVFGTAHDFPTGQTRQDHLLDVGSLSITSGKIAEILGYRTAVLSGPLIVGGTTAVNRIAFFQLLPGASIGVGGDLDTLDVFSDATLSGGTGISVGRDLNWFLVSGSLSLTNGASIAVGRDLGFQPQVPRGTDPGGVGGVIGGNLTIGPGSAFGITRAVDNLVIIEGNFVGDSESRIINGGGRFIALGQIV